MDTDTYRFQMQEIHNMAKEPGGISDQDFYKLVGVMKRLPDGQTAILVQVKSEALPLYITLGGLVLILAVALYLIPFPYNLALGMVAGASIPLLSVIFQRSWRGKMEGMIGLLRETLGSGGS